MRIPFLDLAVVHSPLRQAILDDVASVLDTSAFVNGPQVAQFERAFAAFCRAGSCVGVASGLDALRLGLIGLELEPGDEVIVPAMTFVATWEAVSQVGAIPVPVDVGELDDGLDPESAGAAIGPRTRALVPVHLYGQMADMKALSALADRHGLALVEDACQAHGASRDGIRPGAVSDAAAFSFYPGKNLGAIGDAGALVTGDVGLAERVRALREHGQRRKYEHDEIGWTARLDTIQAAVLLRKLPFLDVWNEERRRAAIRYNDALVGVGDLVLPPRAPTSEPAWHLYVLRTGDPRGLARHLRARGVATGRHYPQPPHLTSAYSRLGYPTGSFPVAERLGRECLSLPLYPGLGVEQQEYIVDAVGAWFAGG